MGNATFWVLVSFVLISHTAFIFFAYWLPTKLGRRQLGVVLAGVLGLLFVISVSGYLFPRRVFANSNVNELLAGMRIELHDEYKILDREDNFIFGMSQKIALEISEADWLRITDLLEDPAYLKKLRRTTSLMVSNDNDYYTVIRIHINNNGDISLKENLYVYKARHYLVYDRSRSHE